MIETNEVGPKPSIAFVTIGDATVPSTRFRALQYFPALQAAGYHVHLFDLKKNGGNKWQQWFGLFREVCTRRQQLRQLSKYDTVIIQKGLSTWRHKGLLKNLLDSGVKYIYDLDDAVYAHLPIQLPGFLRRLQNDAEPEALIRNAQKVIAGNAYLADYVRTLNPRVEVIPTAVDTDKFAPAHRKFKEAPIIGWSGTLSTNQYVNPLIPVLNELAKTRSFRFLVMSNSMNHIQVDQMSGYDLEFLEWTSEREVEYLQRIDIGTMPLADDEWAKGKCGFKALLYMAIGIPSVCSPVGVNTEIIQDGKNGFLASQTQEWVMKLGQLLDDPALRDSLGCAGRQTVEDRYSVAVNFPKFLEVLK